VTKMLWPRKITATDQLVKSGRTVGLVDCAVYDEKQSLVARVSSTCMTPWRGRGAGSLAPS
jgi:acyl-coenzyme A thioesterase PaaI-like protein